MPPALILPEMLLLPVHKFNMPEFTPYPNETSADFAKRMRNQSRSGGMAKAAQRFVQTAEQKKKQINSYS